MFAVILPSDPPEQTEDQLDSESVARQEYWERQNGSGQLHPLTAGQLDSLEAASSQAPLFDLVVE